MLLGALLTFRAKESIPTLVTDALEADVAVAVLASGKGDAFVASLTVETQFAEALPRSVTVTLQGIAARAALGHVAKIARPAWKTLHFAIVAAYIMGVLVLGCWDLACLMATRQD